MPLHPMQLAALICLIVGTGGMLIVILVCLRAIRKHPKD